MPSSSKDRSCEHSQECSDSRDCENPFISFRRYADEQVASMLQSFLGLPSVLNPNWLAANEEAHRKLMDSLGVLPLSQEESRRRLETQESPAMVNESSSYSRQSSSTDDDPLRCPYRPPCEPISEDRERYDTSSIWDRALFTTFLRHSPYSPINLEKHRDLGNTDMQWRRAFEDLMNAQSNKSMGLYDRGLREREWIDACVNRWRNVDPPFKSDKGIAEEFTQQLAQDFDRRLISMSCATRAPENDAGHETELDMYEHVLGAKGGATGLRTGDATPTSLDGVPKAKHFERNELQSPGIMSTLTTTETVSLPDGRVTTKTVLRKRFADGREESKETVHTTQSEQEQKGFNERNGEVTLSDVDGTRRKDEGKKGGWFWS